MHGYTKAALGILIPGLILSLPVPGSEQVTLLPASALWVEGKSTVKDWKCKATSVQASIAAQGEDPIGLVLAGEKSFRAVELSLATANLDCENKTMNEHMMKALKGEQHPQIVFTLDSYELTVQGDNRRGKLSGNLALSGSKKAVVLDVELSTSADGKLRVTGTHALTMTDFGLKPPSLMLGTMKVRDQVVVGFDLLLTRKTN